MKFKYYLFFSIFFISEQLFACDFIVHHVKAESSKDQRAQYFIDLLGLALEKTRASDGCFTLQALKEPMYQARALKSLNKNYGVDIVWTMTSIEREGLYKPVRIPLLKGLLGYRVFIIRSSDEARFSKIQTLEELSVLVAGQGRDWPDALILRENNLKVVEGGDYEGLFGMLQYKRFDYFPRGVNEPWSELLTHPDQGFIIEKSLLLHYVAPIYFFVGKSNSKLAKRIEKGLMIAVKDGSFDKIFRNHPSNKEVFDQANIAGRRIIKLNNPFLSNETPIDNKALWYVP